MSTIESTPQSSTSAIADVANTVAPASGQANGASTTPATQPALEGFDRWIKDFQKYEAVLSDISKANSDVKFREELATIEKWFAILTESEKTASVYSLVQNLTQQQLKFIAAVVQQKITPEETKAASTVLPAPLATVPATPPVDSAEKSGKPKLSKLVRPPSLNLPDLDSPVTPTPVTAKESAIDEQSHQTLLAQAALNRLSGESAPNAANLSNLVSTPLIPLYQKDKEGTSTSKAGSSTNALPGFGGINPYTLNMLANAGLSPEAQVLAAQLVMSGLVQPTALAQPSAKGKKAPPTASWRTPTSARYPASALRSSGLRPSSGLKSAGLKSSGLQSATPLSAMDSPREEDFDPEMLNDIPGWLRGLRLHKYTQCFDGMTWQEMVVLNDEVLEQKGVAALGARRRLLRTFEHVRKRMGMEEPNSATPTTAAIPQADLPKVSDADRVPHSALPRSKLSINSPIFHPSWEGNVPHSASPVVTTSEAVVDGTSTPTATAA